jgi:hypothetical protein
MTPSTAASARNVVTLAIIIKRRTFAIARSASGLKGLSSDIAYP